MHEISSAALFGAQKRAQALAANPLSYVKLNPSNLSRKDLDEIRAIPASTFDNDPRIVRLMGQLNDRKAQVPGELCQWLEAQIAAINGEIATHEQAIARAVFLDAKGKNSDFSQTDKALAQIAYLKGLSASLTASLDALEPFMPEAVAADPVVCGLKRDISDQIWILRVEHLEQQRNLEIDRLNGLAQEGMLYE